MEGKEETTAIAAIWINVGIDRCHVVFLPHQMVKHVARYNGAVAECTCIFSGDAVACDTAEQEQWVLSCSHHCMAITPSQWIRINVGLINI